MKNKYIKYRYLSIALIASFWIHWGAQTVLEFIGIAILTFLLFCGIYFCLKGILSAKLSMKILRGLGILLCIALLWVVCAYAQFRQFNSFACKPNLFGQNFFTKEVKTYCNFIPWYTKQVSDIN